MSFKQLSEAQRKKISSDICTVWKEASCYIGDGGFVNRVKQSFPNNGRDTPSIHLAEKFVDILADDDINFDTLYKAMTVANVGGAIHRIEKIVRDTPLQIPNQYDEKKYNEMKSLYDNMKILHDKLEIQYQELKNENTDLEMKHESIKAKSREQRHTIEQLEEKIRELQIKVKNTQTGVPKAPATDMTVEKMLENIKKKNVYFAHIEDKYKLTMVGLTKPFARKEIVPQIDNGMDLNGDIMGKFSADHPPSDEAYTTKMYEILSQSTIKTCDVARVISIANRDVFIELYEKHVFDGTGL